MTIVSALQRSQREDRSKSGRVIERAPAWGWRYFIRNTENY